VAERGQKLSAQSQTPIATTAGTIVKPLPSVSVVRALECAGNGRIFFKEQQGRDGAWACWRFTWDAKPGSHEVRVRATDESRVVQPHETPWNRLGYLFDDIIGHPVRVNKVPR
jgi:hypothetical protein